MSLHDNPYPPWQPSWESGPQTPPTGPSPRLKMLLFLLLALAVAGVVLASTLPSGHAPRIIGTLLAAGLGLAVAILLARKRSWKVPLAWAVGGLGSAALAWIFVPTTQGLSLWSAHRQAHQLVAALQDMPTGDMTGYGKDKETRESLATLFPALQAQIQEAEKVWADRTLRQQLADLQALPPADIAGFSAGHAARQHLAGLFSTFKPRLDQAELDWGERAAHTAVTRAESLFNTDPTQASVQLQQAASNLAALGENPAAQKHLLAARGRAVLASLNAAQRQTQALVKENRFQAAADAATKLEDTLGSEAKTVGAFAELTRFRESCQFLAELARSAAKTGPK